MILYQISAYQNLIFTTLYKSPLQIQHNANGLGINTVRRSIILTSSEELLGGKILIHLDSVNWWQRSHAEIYFKMHDIIYAFTKNFRGHPKDPFLSMLPKLLTFQNDQSDNTGDDNVNFNNVSCVLYFCDLFLNLMPGYRMHVSSSA